jgi:tetratricopeptide (TPR) repeat protein
MKANLALNDNKASLAEQVLLQRSAGSDYLDVPLFDYELGIAFLFKMDDRAPACFKKFLQHYNGRFFVKDAYQKLSLYYLAKGDPAQALRYKNKIAGVGTTQIDADKQAQRYGRSAGLPNAALVRARMNCEGGYYSLALQTLDPLKPSQLNAGDQVEYFYRYGRVYNLKGNQKGAIPFYEKAIAIGRDRPEQFAARSALELAELYENQGLISRALASYRHCLNMKNQDFKSSIEQKAKAGINRLSGS